MTDENILAFIDTNILVYAFDRKEGEKHTVAAELVESLWQSKTGRLSTQVLQEFHAVVTKSKGSERGLSLGESQEILRSFTYWPVYTIKPNDILQAIDLQGHFLLSFWDAMIVRTAEACNCRILYSEDLSNGQVIEGVRIVNPFLGTIKAK